MKTTVDTGGRTVQIRYRQAEEADLPRAFDVFRAALNAYLVPAGQPPIPDDDRQSPVYVHLLEHDGERFWVAEAVVEELLTGGDTGTLGVGGLQVVGWGCGLVRGDWWFLSNLFVLPEARAWAWEPCCSTSRVRARRRRRCAPPSPTPSSPCPTICTAAAGCCRASSWSGSKDPRWGATRPSTSARSSRSRSRRHRSRRCVRSTRPRSGVDRSTDHRFYLTEGGRYGFMFRRHGRPAGYVMVRQDGWIGTVAAVREQDMETVTAAGIADLSRRGVAEKLRAGVPACSEGAQREFWRAGLRFSGTPGLLLASRPWGHLDRYIPASYGFF